MITIREKEIIECITNGMQAKEIARKLDISPLTVARHIANIHVKLGARNAADVIRYSKNVTTP